MEFKTDYVTTTSTGARIRFILKETRWLLLHHRSILAQLAYLTLLLPLTVLGTVGAFSLLRRSIEESFSRIWPTGSALDMAGSMLCVFAVFFLTTPIFSRISVIAAGLAGIRHVKPCSYVRFLYVVACLLFRTCFCVGAVFAFGCGLSKIRYMATWLGLADHSLLLLLLLLGSSALVLFCYALTSMFLFPHLSLLQPELTIRKAKKTAIRAVRGHRLEIIRFHLAFLPSMLLSILTGGLMLIYIIPYYTTAVSLFASYLLRIGPHGTVRAPLSEQYQPTEVSVT